MTGMNAWVTSEQLRLRESPRLCMWTAVLSVTELGILFFPFSSSLLFIPCDFIVNLLTMTEAYSIVQKNCKQNQGKRLFFFKTYLCDKDT